MSKSAVPDAWDDEWEAAADVCTKSSSVGILANRMVQTASSKLEVDDEPKKLSTKQTKAQKRAAQAEFNRQLWAEAERPKETNYFLETHGVVPLRQDFKPPPVLLSRKGPMVIAPKPPTNGMSNLNVADKPEESSEEEEEVKASLTVEEQKAMRDKERAEKQKKYDEARIRIMGGGSKGAPSNNANKDSADNSGTSSPGDMTPPSSRSATPNRARRGGKKQNNMSRDAQAQQRKDRDRELFDPGYAAKPDSVYLARREQGVLERNGSNGDIKPIRAPKGPDGSGRGGFGFAPRGGAFAVASNTLDGS